jgi:stage III sporulation protein AF
MAEFVKSWIINIIALVLFILLIEIIIPSGKTRKYINLVTGFLLIIAVINPFIKVLRGGVSLEEFQLAGSTELQKLEIKKSSELYKEQQMKQITSVYRQKVIKQLVKSAEETDGVAAAEADVIINEDYHSESFGEIKRAYIYIKPGEEGDGSKPVDSIKRVRVKLDTGPGTEDGDGERQETELLDADNTQIMPGIRNSIEEKISKLFSLEPDNIVVDLQEN